LTGHTDRACFAHELTLTLTLTLARRALETYTTSCCFRLVVRRLEGEPELQRRASLGFGQGMMLLLFGCGVLAFVLVETHAIACSLPGGGGVDPERTGGGLGGRGEGTF
jgi:hypothetical protein